MQLLKMQKDLLASFPAMATSCRTFHNQVIDIETLKIQNISIPQGSFLLTFYGHAHFFSCPHIPGNL